MTKKKIVKRKFASKAKPTAKRKDPSKSKAALAKKKNDVAKEAKGSFKTAGAMVSSLVLERKFTDEEIFEKVVKAFPKYTQARINNTRWNLIHLPNCGKGTDAKEKPLERLFKIDGKLVPKSQMPKPERKNRKKYTEDNDPLKNVAGINVHDKEKKPVTKKPDSKKKRVLKKSSSTS